MCSSRAARAFRSSAQGGGSFSIGVCGGWGLVREAADLHAAVCERLQPCVCLIQPCVCLTISGCDLMCRCGAPRQTCPQFPTLALTLPLTL